jgi:putative holliday junction resolvase
MRIMAVDPGEKRIGIAISDPTGTIANPHSIINHISRQKDALAISELAAEQKVKKIVIGEALNSDNLPTKQGNRARHLADEIRSLCDIPVIMWDESDSTKEAFEAGIKLGTSRKKRKKHKDDIAATVILQTYLDSDRSLPTNSLPD